MFNKIYEIGVIPEEWVRCTFVAIPKKQEFLMSHTLKIFLKVIHRSTYKKLEENIADTQFRFRKASGTRELLFAYNVLMSTKICFIDYNKAFDKMRHK